MQVTISEAAQRLGVSEHTVRRRVRNGELPGSQVATPQGYTWRVEVPDDSPDPAPKAGDGEVQALRDLIATLQGRMEAQDSELAAKNEQIRELHVLLQQAQAALPAPREDRRWWRFWER